MALSCSGLAFDRKESVLRLTNFSLSREQIEVKLTYLAKPYKLCLNNAPVNSRTSFCTEPQNSNALGGRASITACTKGMAAITIFGGCLGKVAETLEGITQFRAPSISPILGTTRNMYQLKPLLWRDS